MKKYCILILCVLCIAVMPLCGCAEGKLELNDWISSRQFPTTYQAFLSEMPAFPTAELTSDGCMLRGLEAWGVTRDNMMFSMMTRLNSCTAWNRWKEKRLHR